jgi:hypothetical protein
VSRYETGEVLPVWSTVHMLLAFYNATEDDLSQAARSVRLPAGASRAFRKLVNAEREAVRMHELTSFGPEEIVDAWASPTGGSM